MVLSAIIESVPFSESVLLLLILLGGYIYLHGIRKNNDSSIKFTEIDIIAYIGVYSMILGLLSFLIVAPLQFAGVSGEWFKVAIIYVMAAVSIGLTHLGEYRMSFDRYIIHSIEKRGHKILNHKQGIYSILVWVSLFYSLLIVILRSMNPLNYLVGVSPAMLFPTIWITCFFLLLVGLSVANMLPRANDFLFDA